MAPGPVPVPQTQPAQAQQAQQQQVQKALHQHQHQHQHQQQAQPGQAPHAHPPFHKHCHEPRIRDNRVLEYYVLNPENKDEKLFNTLDLSRFIGIDANGNKLVWGESNFHKHAKTVTFNGANGELEVVTTTNVTVRLVLHERIFLDPKKGKLEYAHIHGGHSVGKVGHACPHGEVVGKCPTCTSEEERKKVDIKKYVSDTLRDGNIDARSFAVASDLKRNRCRIAYKTQVDDKISLAESLWDEECGWQEPTEIDVYPDVVPGSRFAFAFDPNVSTRRFLFFAEEDGDGYVMMQSYEPSHEVNGVHCPGIWMKPQKLRDTMGREMGVKAHRFSGFAVTSTLEQDGTNNAILLLYFVDESNALLEYVGRYHAPGCYLWHRTMDIEESITLKGHLAAMYDKEKDKTYVLYRNSSRELCMAVGFDRRKCLAIKEYKNTRRRIENREGEAQWSYEVIRNPDQISKNSPLAIAIQSNSDPVAFYIKRDISLNETIYCTSIPSNVEDIVPEKLETCRIGRLEPSSNLGAATMANRDKYPPIRLFSVSKLDGDNVLLERVQRFSHRHSVTTATKSTTSWVISGGVVDTDVECLVPRVHQEGESCGCSEKHKHQHHNHTPNGTVRGRPEYTL